jgi:hypothetical protein
MPDLACLYSQASVVNHLDNGPKSLLVQLGSWDASQRPITEEQRTIISPRELGRLTNSKGPHADRDCDRRGAIGGGHYGIWGVFIAAKSRFCGAVVEAVGDTLRSARAGSVGVCRICRK